MSDDWREIVARKKEEKLRKSEYEQAKRSYQSRHAFLTGLIVFLVVGAIDVFIIACTMAEADLNGNTWIVWFGWIFSILDEVALVYLSASNAWHQAGRDFTCAHSPYPILTHMNSEIS